MPPQQQQLDQDIVRLARAVRKIESGDNFQARGQSGEYGAYQYTPATWAAQSRKYLGRDVALERATPQEQNEVVYKHFKELKDKGYNIGQIASVHNAGAGRPNAYLEGNKGVNKYGVSYDTGAYAEKVAREYQNLKQMGSAYQPPQQVQAAPQVQPEPEQPKGDLLTQTSNFLQGLFPTKNIGEAIGTELAYLFAKPEERQYIQPSQATAGGIAGDVLQNAAYFVGGGAIPAVRGATLASKVGSGVLAGAKYGAGAGALGGAGQQLSQGGTLADAAGGAVSGGITGAALGGALGGAIPALPGIAGRVANRGVQSAPSTVENMIARNAAGQIDTGAEAALSRTAQRTNQVAGRIVQGTPQEARLGAQVLADIDTKGVRTYSDLSKRIGQNVDDQLKKVESEFAQVDTITGPIKLKDLAQKVSAGEGSKLALKVNYVDDALKQLRELYTKTRDIKESLRIKALTEKARKVGLTPSEINTLAKEYGREFQAKGFSKVGQQLTSVSDQAMENTRKGLKETARSFLKSEDARIADKKASDLINVQKLIDKVDQKVNALAQRVEKRNIFQKVARGLGTVIDVATFGAPKALFQKVFLESNVGLKSMNYLDIEARLERNLKLLDRLTKAPDSEIETFLRNLIGGAQQQ